MKISFAPLVQTKPIAIIGGMIVMLVVLAGRLDVTFAKKKWRRNQMAETIVIHCDKCESIMRLSGREVMIVTFLKTALGLGWRNLDTDAWISHGEKVTSIGLGGLCPDCTTEFEEVIQKYS